MCLTQQRLRGPRQAGHEKQRWTGSGENNKQRREVKKTNRNKRTAANMGHGWAMGRRVSSRHRAMHSRCVGLHIPWLIKGTPKMLHLRRCCVKYVSRQRQGSRGSPCHLVGVAPFFTTLLPDPESLNASGPLLPSVRCAQESPSNEYFSVPPK